MKKLFTKAWVMFSALFALTGLMAPFHGASAQTLPKKAIYVIPGYSASQLFLENGTILWIGLATGFDILTPLHSPLANNADGTGMRAKEGSTQRGDITFDEYGLAKTYQPLIDSLRSAFEQSYGGNGAYDVIFFPYNWLGDLSESAAKLETHILQQGYSSVVFVTHSTGGLLASAYVSRGNNSQKVDKAILIAAPLYGTYAALEGLEFGTQAGIQAVFKQLMESDFFQGSPLWGLALSVAEAYLKTYIRTIVRNSSTIYQLLPSNEYLNVYPITTSSWGLKWDRRWVLHETTASYNSAAGLYSVLNNSTYTQRINPLFTNGNTTRNHQYFRETVLGNNISNVLMRLGANNVLLIGNKGGDSSSGFITPISAHYTSKGVLDLSCGGKLDMTYTYDGDGVVSGFSASLNNFPSLRFSNYPGINHADLAKDSSVISEIISEIP